MWKDIFLSGLDAQFQISRIFIGQTISFASFFFLYLSESGRCKVMNLVQCILI